MHCSKGPNRGQHLLVSSPKPQPEGFSNQDNLRSLMDQIPFGGCAPELWLERPAVGQVRIFQDRCIPGHPRQNKLKAVNCGILGVELCPLPSPFPTPPAPHLLLMLQLVTPQCVGEIHYYERIVMEVILLFDFLPRLPGFKFQAL